MAYATHESTQCDITINDEILPVSYITEPRGNPDNSFYPGDAFHYLFTFTAIPECISFSVKPVISEGVFDVISHNSIIWNNSIENTHTHQDLEMQLQYLTTTHYYVDKISYVDCDGYRCQEITLAENPSYSIREDQEQSTSLQNLLDGLSTASTYDIRTEETQDWGFADADYLHEHGDYLHSNESDESIESFEDYVESKCSNLEKYSGCVFGHVELEIKLVDEKCLFAELYKANISHDMVNDQCVDVDHTLSLSIAGTKINCYYLDGKEICDTIQVEQTKNITPNVLSPEFEIVFLAMQITRIIATDYSTGSEYLIRDIPENLLILMGISVAVPIISSKSMDEKKISKEGVSSFGMMFYNKQGNLDLARLQMFLWTIIGIVIYLYIVFDQFSTLSSANDLFLPDVSPTLLILMGLSQGAYLGSKFIGNKSHDSKVADN